MSRTKIFSFVFISLVAVCACYKALIKGTPPKLNFVRPVDTIIVNNKGELDFQRKADWIEKMHWAEPGVDWRSMDQKTRLNGYNLNRNLTPQAVQGLSGTWREMGSNNLAGRMHCADYDAASGFLYCGSSGGNVWRSNLSGNGWICLNDRLKMNNIRSLRVINLGSIRRIIVCSERNVFYSDNDGALWNSATGFSGPQSWGGLKRLVLANDGPRTAYVLAEEWDYTNWYAVTSVYRSVDEGGNFSKVAVFPNPTYGDTSKFDIWADFFGNGDVFLVENANVNVINGNGITKIASYPLSVSGSVYLSGRQTGAMTHLYVLVAHDGKSDIYGSDGTGGNWTYRGFVSETPFMLNSFECALDDDRLYLGGVDGHLSYDGGANWQITSEWYEYYGNPSSRLHADICGINALKSPNNSEVVLLSTDGGMYSSTDGVTSVNNISLSNLKVSQYYSIYSNRLNRAKIYAGSQDQGFQFGVNGQNPFPGDLTQVISGDYGHLTSSDRGQSVWCVYPGFAMYAEDNNVLATKDFICSNQLWMPPLMADPENPANAYLGGGRTSGGAHLYYLKYSSGQITYAELPYDFCPGTNEKISALAGSPLNPSYRYVMTSDGKFYFSTDTGNTWTQSAGFQGPPPHYFYGSCILASPIKLGRVYISGSGYSNPPVYFSDDNGLTFSALNQGLPNTLVYEIAANENESVLFAATDVGPYALINGSWVNISQNIAPDQTYWTVDVIPGVGVVRFGTYGRGIWEYKLNTPADLLGTWDGQGVYFRNSATGIWKGLATPADLIAGGDLDGDGIDDLIGIWSGQAGVWVKNSGNGNWAYLGSTPRHIATGDMNGDGRADLVGTWDGQGVFYKDSISGSWVQMASPATLISAGDLDGDGKADLIGIWPSQAGVWVKYSTTGNWSYLGSSPRDIAAGDMNGDGRVDLMGTWDGQGVFYKDSISGNWVMMATPADQIAAGDLDGDGTDDLIGIWAGQAGVWVKYSKTGQWAYIGSSARDIAAGKMSGGSWGAGSNQPISLSNRFGGLLDGPSPLIKYEDLSFRGPGGNQFLFEPGRNLVPRLSKSEAKRIPGPGEPGFKYTLQKNIFPGQGENKQKAKER